MGSTLNKYFEKQPNSSASTMPTFDKPSQLFIDINLRKNEYFYNNIDKMFDKISKDTEIFGTFKGKFDKNESIICTFTTDIHIYFKESLNSGVIQTKLQCYQEYSEEEVESMIWCLHSSLINYEKNISLRNLKLVKDGTKVYRGQTTILDLDKVKIGEKFDLAQFVSTTPSISSAKTHGDNIMIITIKNNEKNNYCYFIQNCSILPEEEEILITCFSTFVLTKVRNDEKGNFIYELDCLGYTLGDYFSDLEKGLKEEIMKQSKILIGEIVDMIPFNSNTLEVLIILEKLNNEKNKLYIDAKNKKYKVISEINSEMFDIAESIAKKKAEKRELINNIGKYILNMPQTVIIRSVLAYKNLDIQHNKIANGTPIILYDAHGGDPQLFELKHNGDGTVTFYKKGYAIDVRYSEIKNGTVIHIWQSNGTNAQKFYLKKRGEDLYSIHSSINQNYCIDVNGSMTHNFNKIQLWNWNGTNAQIFKLIYP